LNFYKKRESIMNVSCLCSEQRVEVTGEPVLRFKCHCLICQKVYGKPFSDVVVVKSSQVSMPPDSSIEFTRHSLPPAVNRGVCPSCNKPVVAFLPLAPFFGLAFIAAENFPESVELPEPVVHLFYHRRIEDANDSLPKSSGYLGSQWAVARHLVPALLAHSA
jgi:hypothetical protein